MIRLFAVLSLAGCLFSICQALGQNQVVSASFFSEKIQPLFNARCIACHSCFESPCQLNLQTYSGAQRGANSFSVYAGNRLDEMAPSRMFEDAHSISEWRSLGFRDVLSSADKSVLWRFVAMTENRQIYPSETVRENLTCAPTPKEISRIEKYQPELGMPYALPSLNPREKADLKTWILAGAPGKAEELSLQSLTATEKKVVLDWQNYLNRSDLKSRLVARYLFEHLFLAHFYIPGNNEKFLRLVRSKTTCEKGINPVQARQPNDDPGGKDWSYCFYVDPAATVYKKHIPYELSDKKLSWIRSNFEREAWSTKAFPGFQREVSRNPFVAFRDIPPAARYRFLLEDSRYHIMTFIKGPVCNGSVAVNSIQEQFFVFFVDPKADVDLRDSEFATQSESLMVLPGNFSAKEGVAKAMTDFKTITELRNRYRSLKSRVTERLYPKGLPLEHIWNGDGINPNAALTVFRHDDNAEVLWGARGDLAKTVFLLDYSIFERLVYNLVVNFDVFANAEHQAMTRLYMDLIRMEAENNYLEFLPPEERLKLKESWYQGPLTSVLLDVLDEKQFPKIPSQIQFTGSSSHHHQLIEKILFDRMNVKTRGDTDFLNWKKLRHPEIRPTAQTSVIRGLTSRNAKDKAFYAKLFPEFSILVLMDSGKVVNQYSIIRNREHQNISWMFAENFRLDPDADTLTMLEGIHGAYPNQIFQVEADQFQAFGEELKKLRMKRDYQAFQLKYGLSRRDPKFWPLFDQIQAEFKKASPLEAGYLDLSRYRMEPGLKEPGM